ncbi:MAG: HNH endonuclease [Patescibacteria group bacterium]|nr:HNH endonuclease [Patescibacteria group bacterium]
MWTASVARSNSDPRYKNFEYGTIGNDPKRNKISSTYKTLKTHRVSYELYKGQIPKGMEVDHICTNTLCVNPEHLQLTTRGENSHLGHVRKHGNSCRRGHEFTAENTWIEKNGIKHCRQCRRENQRLLYKRRKERLLCQPL